MIEEKTQTSRNGDSAQNPPSCQRLWLIRMFLPDSLCFGWYDTVMALRQYLALPLAVLVLSSEN